MTTQKKIFNLSSAQDLIQRIAGEDAIRVVRIYERKGRYVSDEELAKKMRLKVTEVRTILNRLHYRGITCYQKKKNTKTGWYSYTWGVKNKRIAEILLEELTEKRGKLETKQELQTNYGLFSCTTLCETVPFEVAAEYGFRCPVCGKTMDAMDNKRAVKKTEKELQGINIEIEEIKKSK